MKEIETSRPTRARGLKHRTYSIRTRPHTSRPTRARGLKPVEDEE